MHRVDLNPFFHNVAFPKILTISKFSAAKDGKSYPLSYRAFNAAAVGLLTVGSRAAQDPTIIIKLAATTLNTLQLNG